MKDEEMAEEYAYEKWTDYPEKQEIAEQAYLAGAEKQKKKDEKQLTKAKDHIKKLLDCLKQDTNDPQTNYYVCQYMDKAEQFLKEIEK